jgi:hypothetical protein
MKIAVLFNCQGRGLTAALQAMLPDASVDYFAQSGGAERAAVAAALSQYDHVVSIPLGPLAGSLASRKLRGATRHFISLPAIGFSGFHPDQIYVRRGRRNLTTVTGDYHSRIAVAGFLAGLGAPETASLYNRLVFARLGYFDMYESEFVLLAERFSQYGHDATELLASLRGWCFMHSVNHPKPRALIGLARLACRAIGATPRAIDDDSVPDDLRAHPAHPVFEDVAKAAGVAPEGAFRAQTPQGADFRPISTADFVAGSFAAYENLDRAALRAADGVLTAMQALGLQEWPHQAVRKLPIDGVALMSWHGTLLREPPESPLHLPLSVPATDAPFLRGAWQDGTDTDVLVLPGGVQASPAWRSRVVALANGASFIAAEAGAPQTRCLRDAPGDSETFLPASEAELGVLQQLLSGEWAPAGDANGHAAHMASGPAVSLGAFRIDLIEAWPELLPPAPNGAPRMFVLLNGAPAVLRQTARPPEPQHLAARSVALGESMVLAGEDIFLPLPLTLNNAERRWLHRNCTEPDGLPWRNQAPRAVIARVRDQRLVGPPPPQGAPLPRDGVLEGAIVLLEAAGGEASGWMAPLLRLLAMAPFLQTGTSALALAHDADAAALEAAWAWAGLPAWPVVAPPLGLYTGRDVAWIDPALPWQWPAETLQAARSILLRGAEPGAARLFLHGPEAAALSNSAALLDMGFEALDMSAPAPRQLARLREAGLVIGVGDDLLAAAFCPSGTKVIELCGEDQFRPAAWMLSCALGMSHAVLPCAGLNLDARRLGLLLDMMRYRS